MNRIALLTTLVPALALAAIVWSKPLQKTPFWSFVLLCVLFHPAGSALFSALNSTAGTAGTVAEWTFMCSANVLFAALVASAYRAIKCFRGTRANGHSYHQEVDA